MNRLPVLILCLALPMLAGLSMEEGGKVIAQGPVTPAPPHAGPEGSQGGVGANVNADSTFTY
jgi:hypothetical protein